jgi:nitrate reductase NapE component
MKNKAKIILLIFLIICFFPFEAFAQVETYRVEKWII